MNERHYLAVIRVTLALAAPLIGASAVAQHFGMGWLIAYSILSGASVWTILLIGERTAPARKEGGSCCRSRTRRGTPTR